MSKRTALIAAGVVLVAGGAVTAIAGGATLAIAGTDGTLSSGQHALTSDTSALVSDRADIEVTMAGTGQDHARALEQFTIVKDFGEQMILPQRAD